MSIECGAFIPADSSEQLYTTDHVSWRLNDHGAYMGVESPLLGDYPIHGRPEDPLVIDLLRTPLAWRGFDITQLSKLREHTTIPNTASFSRAGHVIDLIEITDRLAREIGASDEQRLAWKLYQLEDTSHGPLSHATDIAFGNGGETFHAERQPQAILYGGMRRVLKQRGVKVNERGMIPGVALPPWVECKAPNICTDRWQYGVEESRLWFADSNPDKRLADLQDMIFKSGQIDAVTIIEDGNMAFKDVDLARVYAKSYLLLSTEHWNDPVNRVQLHLLIETIKRSILTRRLGHMSDIDNGVTRKAESYTYAVDHDISEAMRTGPGNRDDFMYASRALLSAIGKQERERYLVYKREQYARFIMDEHAVEYPSEILNGHLVDFGPPSSQIEVDILSSAEAAPTKKVAAQITDINDEGIRYTLHPLKNRFVNPLVVMRDGTARPLSEIDENYARILEQHAQVQRSSLNVRLMLASRYEQELKEGIVANELGMTDAQKADALSEDQQRRQIEAAGERAKVSAQKAGTLVLKNTV